MATPAIITLPKVATDAMAGKFPLLTSSTKKDWELLITTMENHKTAFTGPAFTFGGDKVPGQNPGIAIHTAQGSFLTLLGEMYRRIWSKYVEGNFSAALSYMQGWMERIRDMAVSEGVKESDVALTWDVNVNLSNGLNATCLTLIPDTNLGVRFGSVPDQTIIGVSAPAWTKFKRRCYESTTGALGAKPHYVLAHMLNHNLNGSGSDAHNVTPFWATANTQMAKLAEKQLKEFVWRGFETQYSISFGPLVGFAARRPILEQILTNNGVTIPVGCLDPVLLKLKSKLGGNALLQFEIVELEQHLTTYLKIEAKAYDPSTASWIVVVDVQIDNFVPNTIPTLM